MDMGTITVLTIAYRDADVLKLIDNVSRTAKNITKLRFLILYVFIPGKDGDIFAGREQSDHIQVVYLRASEYTGLGAAYNLLYDQLQPEGYVLQLDPQVRLRMGWDTDLLACLQNKPNTVVSTYLPVDNTSGKFRLIPGEFDEYGVPAITTTGVLGGASKQALLADPRLIFTLAETIQDYRYPSSYHGFYLGMLTNMLLFKSNMTILQLAEIAYVTGERKPTPLNNQVDFWSSWLPSDLKLVTALQQQTDFGAHIGADFEKRIVNTKVVLCGPPPIGLPTMSSNTITATLHFANNGDADPLLLQALQGSTCILRMGLTVAPTNITNTLDIIVSGTLSVPPQPTPALILARVGTQSYRVMLRLKDETVQVDMPKMYNLVSDDKVCNDLSLIPILNTTIMHLFK
jgi:hypothetical protein